MIRLMPHRARPRAVCSESIDERADGAVNHPLNQGVVHLTFDPLAAVQILALEVEFDMATASQIDLAVDQGIDAGAHDFVADLSEVAFVDGTAVHALLRGWKRAARLNGRFVLVNPPERVWRVFVLIGLGPTFATFASRQRALTYLKGRRGPNAGRQRSLLDGDGGLGVEQSRCPE